MSGISMVLPVHAGMIPLRRDTPTLRSRAPRTCGDDPIYQPVTFDWTIVLPVHAGMIPEKKTFRE